MMIGTDGYENRKYDNSTTNKDHYFNKDKNIAQVLKTFFQRFRYIFDKLYISSLVLGHYTDK